MLNMSWEECYKQYTPLCYKMSHKYRNVRLEHDERFNLAVFALWKAWENYDESKPASFLTYATFMICREFNLVYRNDNLQKRKHDVHLDINHEDDNGNRFEEVIEDDSIRSYHHMQEIVKCIDEFSKVASVKGLMFVDKVNDIPVSEIMEKYGKAKRTAYKWIDKGKEEFIKYLEEKDVWL